MPYEKFSAGISILYRISEIWSNDLKYDRLLFDYEMYYENKIQRMEINMKNERTLTGRTDLLYETDAYLETFTATVSDCVPFENLRRKQETGVDTEGLYAIELNRTAFFPEGGGQTCDTGSMNGCPVSDVFKEDGKIWHITTKEFAVGEEVEGKLDFVTRFRKMQNHSGEHVVSGIIASKYGYENVGFHMSQDSMSVDVSGVLTKEDFDIIEQMANEVVYKNKKIYTVYPDSPDEMDYRSKIDLEEDIRVVVIEDTDACACCAPHVKNTGEIGLIKIIDFMSYKGGTRFFMKCGQWAYEDVKKAFDQNKEIGRLLSVSPENSLEAVNKLLDTGKQKKEEENELKNLIVELYLDKMKSERVFFAPKLDEVQLRKIINESVKTAKDIVAGFVGTDTTGYRYIIGKNEQATDIDLRQLAKDMNTALNGRGGGSDKMVQGSVQSSKVEIKDFFEK